MIYIPTTSSASTVSDLRSWVSTELLRVSNALTSASQTTTVPVITVAPAKPIIGQVVFADGTTWNPNNGRGLYYYDTGGWIKIA
jgi:hypothetical protein